ncbi:MAG TPA: hypothetical protein VKB84_03650 [Candidatus Binataceae bacterium]|jgi:hypothetical protein|nr:hypothetical protein [Candidatus Binataceae bacterium]
MNPETHYLRELGVRAGRKLPPDFSSQVMRDAKARRRRSQRNRWTVITVALCIAIALAAHWINAARINRTNLELWSKAAQQAAALEVAI